jgi:hypothetical protein
MRAMFSALRRTGSSARAPATVGAVTTSQPASELDDILGRQAEFDQAELVGHAEVLDRLLVNDFQSIGEQGYVLDKQQWIAKHQDFRYLGIESTDVDVRRYDRTAIVRRVQLSRAVWQGTEMSLRTRVVCVWVEQADGWQLASIQFSSLSDG